jgi:hypothetical protein
MRFLGEMRAEEEAGRLGTRVSMMRALQLMFRNEG